MDKKKSNKYGVSQVALLLQLLYGHFSSLNILLRIVITVGSRIQEKIFIWSLG